MLGKIIKVRKYKKMIKASATSMLNDFIQIADDTASHFEKDSKIKGCEKLRLDYEPILLIFWLFLRSGLFPEAIHKLLLDEVYNQYYEYMRKIGCDSDMIRVVNHSINLRNKKYNEVFGEDNDYSRVATQFVRFIYEGLEIEPNACI